MHYTPANLLYRKYLMESRVFLLAGFGQDIAGWICSIIACKSSLKRNQPTTAAALEPSMNDLEKITGGFQPTSAYNA